jgi:phenylalanyl-tRNA synthetase beta chain
MKLSLSLLSKLIDLPNADEGELRKLFDDLGLEVKDIAHDSRGAIFTIETLANRGDHLSALGVAREIAARTLVAPHAVALQSSLPDKRPSVPIRRETDLCLRYALMECELSLPMKLRPDVAAHCLDPQALHPLVSVLNYVQSEIGQPMHAFDRDAIDGEIRIDVLSQSEEIEALDNHRYQVPVGSIVIRDRVKIVAIAGVIGCKNSMVTDSTKRVLIESAVFDPVSVRKTARALGLITDAAYAFERGVDIDGHLVGLKRVAHLLQSPGGSDGTHHVIGHAIAPEVMVNRATIELSMRWLREQLGMSRLDTLEVCTRLKYLGYAVQQTSATKGKEMLQVTAPTWRVWDVQDQSDLLEDVARSVGYNSVKLAVPELDYHQPPLSPRSQCIGRIEPVLVASGFFEVITKVFYAAREAELIERQSEGRFKAIALKNSIESAYSHLKTTNLIHAARLAEANHRRGVETVKCYEIGQLFGHDRGASDEYLHETTVLTLWQSGRWQDSEWRGAESREQKVRLFVGVIEQLAASLGATAAIYPSKDPLFHPGCQGELRIGRISCGHFGLCHPSLQHELDVKHELLYGEFRLDALVDALQPAQYVRQSEFPAIRRDITVRLGMRDLAQSVKRYIERAPIFEEATEGILSDVTVCDDFNKNDEDFRRVTYRITFQRQDGTLEHSVIDGIMERLFAYLATKGHGLV